MNWLVLLTYLVQVVTIVVFPIPSEASSLKLLRQRHVPLNATRRNLLMVLGGLGIVTFHLPLLFVLVPAAVPDALYLVDDWQRGVRLVLAGLCLVGGTVLSSVAVLSLRRRLTTVTEQEEVTDESPRSLHTEGIYGFCRHPINAGLMLLMAGYFLVFPLWIMVPGVIAFFVNLHARARLEEAWLEQRFGVAWRDYRVRVSMYGLSLRPLLKPK